MMKCLWCGTQITKETKSRVFYQSCLECEWKYYFCQGEGLPKEDEGSSPNECAKQKEDARWRENTSPNKKPWKK